MGKSGSIIYGTEFLTGNGILGGSLEFLVLLSAFRVPIVAELNRDQVVWGPECLVRPKVKVLYEQVMASRNEKVFEHKVVSPCGYKG